LGDERDVHDVSEPTSLRNKASVVLGERNMHVAARSTGLSNG